MMEKETMTNYSTFDGNRKQRTPGRDKVNLSAAGSPRRAIIALEADCSDHAGDHSFLRMSRHISPVCEYHVKFYQCLFSIQPV